MWLRQAPSPGHKRTVNLREIMNAILYLNRLGCQWRMLRHDLPYWQHVSTTSTNGWRMAPSSASMIDRLRLQIRTTLGCDELTSAAVIDSQSGKTTEEGEAHGYDAGKRVKGRKRHVLVDMLGLLIMVIVSSAALPIAREPPNCSMPQMAACHASNACGLIRVMPVSWGSGCSTSSPLCSVLSVGRNSSAAFRSCPSAGLSNVAWDSSIGIAA
jgi:transposase